jgi:hypothetical protein
MPRRSASVTRACNGSGPGRMKKFKVSDGPDFVTKAEGVAGPYRDLPEKTLVLSIAGFDFARQPFREPKKLC